MGRRASARNRRKLSVFLAAVVAPAAVLFATGGDVYPTAAGGDAESMVVDDAPCCLEIVAATPGDSLAVAGGPVGRGVTAASRFHTRSRFLPEGVAPERGLQVRTILAARSISAEFPQIHDIGGVRPDALRWHPNGLALDVMIPHPSTRAGIALGDEIVAFVLENAGRFGMQDAIWRGVYYTPGGARSTGVGHYDHVHVTTTGGGYPSGNELYLR